MAGKIQTMIPQYGELNRIYRDYIDNYAFSFDRQKFISDFYQEYNDMKSFEAAILELVLDKQKEQYTLILNSLKTEIEKSIQAYEIRPLSDRAIERVCYQHMERYSQEIEAQLDVLVDGEFVQAKHDISLRFRGSSNQRLLDVKKTLAAGEPVWWEDEKVFATHTMEK
jgi:hypothetical protein